MRNECVHMSLEDIYKDVLNNPMPMVVLYFSISPPTLYNTSMRLVDWSPHPQSQSHNQ